MPPEPEQLGFTLGHSLHMRASKHWRSLKTQTVTEEV